MPHFNPVDFKALRAVGGRHTTLVADLPIDTETPVSLYAKLCQAEPYAFLFESAVPNAERGRYSFVGFDPLKVFRFEGDERGSPLEVLREALDSMRMVYSGEIPKFPGGLVGYFAYEVVRHFEPIPKPEAPSAIPLPEGIFFIPSTILVFDHVAQRLSLHRVVDLEGEEISVLRSAEAALEHVVQRLQIPVAFSLVQEVEPSNSFLSFGASERVTFLDSVERAKEAILNGEVFQLVLSQVASFATDRSALELYRSLRRHNPSPYMFLMALESFSIVGASPETLVQMESGVVTVRPIAGTRPRGLTPEDDVALEAALRADPKELAEHRMLVDLARNDVGRIAQPGTVKVSELLGVQRFASVMHLVSEVQGRSRAGMDAFDVFQACFPAGTLTGAPKVRAMELIAAFERRQRGLYGGAIGYFGFNGNMDFAIAIRTAVLKDGRFSIQAGAGVVYDSIPEREHEECVHKAKSTLTALR